MIIGIFFHIHECSHCVSSNVFGAAIGFLGLCRGDISHKFLLSSEENPLISNLFVSSISGSIGVCSLISF